MEFGRINGDPFLELCHAFHRMGLVRGPGAKLACARAAGEIFIGLFIGAGLPFLFAALTIDAVGRAATKMIEEVRRQFRLSTFVEKILDALSCADAHMEIALRADLKVSLQLISIELRITTTALDPDPFGH